jgi:ABC-type molybdenum transport system ATPase subunit/photorepair protein PhrA
LPPTGQNECVFKGVFFLFKIRAGRSKMTIPHLDLRQVTYALNGKKLLDAVSWTVAEGDHWAILGPNGAGKTTLLKLACGDLWPNAGGEIYRKGKQLVNLSELRRSPVAS